MPYIDEDKVSSDGSSNPPPGTVAKLETINFAAILGQDENEIAKLAHVCERDGFFYLDLTDRGSSKMHECRDYLTRVVKDWMLLPREKKCNTYTTSVSHGFKPTGTQSGALESHKDGFEALKVGFKELAGRWALPDIVNTHLDVFDRYTKNSHFVLKTLLAALNSVLEPSASGEGLEKWHRDDWSSMSTLYFLNYPREAAVKDNGSGQNMHTDIGSLTLLFTEDWGLQVLSLDTNKEWQWVETKPNHAIVNVGDTLRFLSQGRFRSALHRAVLVDGQERDRFSVSYFLRSNDHTEFEASDGIKSNAQSWLARKYAMYDEPHEVQKQQTVLTGGMLQMIEKAS